MNTKDEIEALRTQLASKNLELVRIKADYDTLKTKYKALYTRYETKLREMQKESDLSQLQAQEAWLQGEMSGWNMGWNTSSYDGGLW